MIFIFLFFFILTIYLDMSYRKIISLSLMPLIFLMSISFLSIDSANQYLFLYQAKPSLTSNYYFLFILTCIFFLLSILLSNIIIGKDTYQLKVGLIKSRIFEVQILKRLFYFTFVISFLAFLYNFNALLEFRSANMQFDARDYESAFGSVSVINYFYFFHVITIFCFTLLKLKYHTTPKFGMLFCFVMIFSALFHGVKFTVFDALVPSLVLYYLYAEKIKMRFVFMVLGFFILFLWIFFSFIRGASDEISWYEAILNYIIPNYYNLMHIIQNHGMVSDFGYSLWYPPKLPVPDDIHKNILLTEGFQLNFRYNMYTALNAGYRSFGIFAGIIIMFAAVLTAFFYKQLSRKSGVIYTFIFSMCILSNTLMFYYWTYNKLKYWWLILAVIGIVTLLKLRIERR